MPPELAVLELEPEGERAICPCKRRNAGDWPGTRKPHSREEPRPRRQHLRRDPAASAASTCTTTRTAVLHARLNTSKIRPTYQASAAGAARLLQARVIQRSSIPLE